MSCATYLLHEPVMEPTRSCPTLKRGKDNVTSEKGKGFLPCGCCENSDETVFATDGDGGGKLRLGDAFGIGEMISGE